MLERVACAASGTKFLVFIEALDTVNLSDLTAIVAQLNALVARLPVCCVVIGVGNKASCTAALDSCLETVNQCKQFLKCIRLRTISNDDLLGHDKVI